VLTRYHESLEILLELLLPVQLEQHHPGLTIQLFVKLEQEWRIWVWL
jgi:hypothetical protein